MNCGVPIIPGWSYPCQTAVLRGLQRKYGTKLPRLMSYFIPSEQTWVIGEWTNKRLGLVREFFSYQHPAQIKPGDLASVVFWARQDMRAKTRQWAAAQAADSRKFLAEQRAKRMQRNDEIRFMLRTAIRRESAKNPELWQALYSRGLAKLVTGRVPSAYTGKR